MSKQSMFAAPMAGEISPNIMFGKMDSGWEHMSADVCGGVCMGALGCRGTGGQENKVSRGENGPTGCVLLCVVPDKKTHRTDS